MTEEDLKRIESGHEPRRQYVSELIAEVRGLQSDLKDAAGELLVDAPEPGTEKAKLVSANVLMRRENQTLRELIRGAQVAIDAYIVCMKLGPQFVDFEMAQRNGLDVKARIDKVLK